MDVRWMTGLTSQQSGDGHTVTAFLIFQVWKSVKEQEWYSVRKNTR